MENKIDTTENNEEIIESETTSQENTDSSEDSDATSKVQDTAISEDDFEERSVSVGDTIMIPKHTVDEETVEQLVENRTPQRNTTISKKKKRKKNHYGLKTLIVLLAFVLVFVISFFFARILFTLDDKNTNAEVQKATDITEKTTEDANTEDKVIIAQQPDGDEEDGEKATAIKIDDDFDEPSSVNKQNNKQNSSQKNNQSSSSKPVKNNSSKPQNNSNSESEKSPENDSEKNVSDDSEYDGGIILPGTPSTDDESDVSGGSAGIELE